MNSRQPKKAPLFREHETAAPTAEHHRPSPSGETPSIRSRAKNIAREAEQDIRTALSDPPLAKPGEKDLVGLETRGFRPRRVPNITMSDQQTEKMSEALRGHARLLAAEHLQNIRSGKIPAAEEPPALHKAQKISFEGRKVKIHLGSRGITGRNVVALPRLIQSGNSVIRAGRGVALVDLHLEKDGKQTIDFAGGKLVKGAQGIALQFCFSDERERLRDKAPERD